MAVLERDFQSKLIKELKERYPDCIVIKGDTRQYQGMPDLVILHGSRWAALELKRGNNASHRPNQDWYVNRMDSMSFARFIDPDNKEEVLHDLDQSFKS